MFISHLPYQASMTVITETPCILKEDPLSKLKHENVTIVFKDRFTKATGNQFLNTIVRVVSVMLHSAFWHRTTVLV